MIGQELPFFCQVFLGRGGGIDIEVIAPAGKFKAVITHFFSERRELGERKIGPLAGEERDRSGHWN